VGKILSIDPGRELGYAIMDSKDGLLNYGIYRSDAFHRFAALNDYANFLEDLVAEQEAGGPELQAILCEEVLQGSCNLRSDTAVFWLLGTYLAAGLVADRAGVKFETIHPATIKKHMAGQGRATKDEMIAAVSVSYGLAFKLSESHIADAVSLGDCYFARQLA